jgi:hypothetical protein
MAGKPILSFHGGSSLNGLSASSGSFVGWPWSVGAHSRLFQCHVGFGCDVLGNGTRDLHFFRRRDDPDEPRSLSRTKHLDRIHCFGSIRWETSGLDMVEFDVEGSVKQLDGMGLKLTAVPLAEGWRTMDAVEHREQIQDLWASQIGDSHSRIETLAAHLYIKVQ